MEMETKSDSDKTYFATHPYSPLPTRTANNQ